MKTKLFILLLFVAASVTHAATDWDIYSDDSISSGNYGFVNVFNGASLDIDGTSTTIEWLETHNSNTVNLYNGSILTFRLDDISAANIFNGELSTFELWGNSVAHIYGGQITYSAYIFDSGSVIHFYGYDFTVIPSGSSYYLSGYWENDEYFNIWLRGPNTYSQSVLHVIPEPFSLALLVIGGFILKRKVHR